MLQKGNIDLKEFTALLKAMENSVGGNNYDLFIKMEPMLVEFLMEEEIVNLCSTIITGSYQYFIISLITTLEKYAFAGNTIGPCAEALRSKIFKFQSYENERIIYTIVYDSYYRNDSKTIEEFLNDESGLNISASSALANLADKGCSIEDYFTPLVIKYYDPDSRLENTSLRALKYHLKFHPSEKSKPVECIEELRLQKKIPSTSLKNYL